MTSTVRVKSSNINTNPSKYLPKTVTVRYAFCFYRKGCTIYPLFKTDGCDGASCCETCQHLVLGPTVIVQGYGNGESEVRFVAQAFEEGMYQVHYFYFIFP